MVAELARLVELETGVEFASPPVVRVATVDEARTILYEEFLPQLRLQAPEARPEQVEQAGRELAEFFATRSLGKYAGQEGAVLLLPENFVRYDTLLADSRLNTEQFLRTVLVHELVHALDQQRFEIMTSLDRLGDREDLEVWNALVEGHAQFVTRRILTDLDAEQLFEQFEEYILAVPAGADESDRYLHRLMSSTLRFGYVDGRHFFEGLAERYPDRPFVEDVFASPPADKSAVLHPETFYEGRPARTDLPPLDPLWGELHAQLGEGWDASTRTVDEVGLRATFGDFVEAQKVARVVSHLQDSEALVSSRAGESPANAVSAVFLMASSESARDFFDLLEELHRAKDERLKEGKVRIVSSSYSSYDFAVPTLIAAKELELDGRRVTVHDILALAGPHVVEIYSDEPVESASVFRERLATILRYLGREP